MVQKVNKGLLEKRDLKALMVKWDWLDQWVHLDQEEKEVEKDHLDHQV